MKFFLRIFDKIIFILIVSLIVVFCLNNNQVATISLQPLDYQIETRMFILILISVFGGILIGFALCSISLGKAKLKNFMNIWRIKSLQRKISKVNAKNQQDEENIKIAKP